MEKKFRYIESPETVELPSKRVRDYARELFPFIGGKTRDQVIRQAYDDSQKVNEKRTRKIRKRS